MRSLICVCLRILVHFGVMPIEQAGATLGKLTNEQDWVRIMREACR